MVPLLLVVVAMLTIGKSARPREVLVLSLVLVATACAVGGSQPNGLYGAALLGSPLAVVRVSESDWAHVIRRAVIAVLIAVASLIVVVTVLVPWPLALNTGSPQLTGFRSVFLGAVLLLWFGAYAVPRSATRYLTWPWWNGMQRVLAVATIPAAILVGLGGQGIAAFFERRGRQFMAVAVAVVLLSMTAAMGMRAPWKIATLGHWYSQSGYPRITSPELASLRELGSMVPESSAVAINPWLGGEYLYLASGRRPLFPQANAVVRNPDADLIGQRVDRILQDSAVCAAAHRLVVQFVISGGDVGRVPGQERGLYVGLERSRGVIDFRLVASAGPYELRQVPPCG